MEQAKISCAIRDLTKVPLSSELSDLLGTHKGKTAVIISNLDEATRADSATVESKRAATERAEEDMKPINADLKEALRRIRVAGKHLTMQPRMHVLWAVGRFACISGCRHEAFYSERSREGGDELRDRLGGTK